MTQVLADHPRRAAMPAAPLRAGAPLSPDIFAAIRMRLMLRHCKWDPQVEDLSTLAPFPLLMRKSEWLRLCADAEVLAAEIIEAERELLERPKLDAALAIPRPLRKALRAAAPTPVAVRVMRFDFHPTRDGWRISEVNSDVPGGFCEASEFPRLVAPHVSSAQTPTDTGATWADALARAASGHVALLTAPGFMEDQQVVRYMGQLLVDRGLTPHMTDPTQLIWRDGNACLRDARLGAVVRFYQAEWLANLPRRHRDRWLPLATGGRTPVTNPMSSALTESKRFPLVWDRLRTRLPAWRRLLPETCDPRDAPWQTDDRWLVKTAFCNTGDSVSAASLMTAKDWRKTRWLARLFPRQWVAQRRFDALPLTTPIGEMHCCVGIYTIDGRAAGAYARVSHRPVIDYRAIDAALLIERDETRER